MWYINPLLVDSGGKMTEQELNEIWEKLLTDDDKGVVLPQGDEVGTLMKKLEDGYSKLPSFARSQGDVVFVPMIEVQKLLLMHYYLLRQDASMRSAREMNNRVRIMKLEHKLEKMEGAKDGNG